MFILERPEHPSTKAGQTDQRDDPCDSHWGGPLTPAIASQTHLRSEQQDSEIQLRLCTRKLHSPISAVFFLVLFSALTKAELGLKGSKSLAKERVANRQSEIWGYSTVNIGIMHEY